MRRMYSKPQLLEAVEQESKINGIKVFEDIKDKDGQARFIEGDIVLSEIEGITWTYGKWSLSGTHLLIVICGTLDNAATFTTGTFAQCNVPSWVLSKIYPLYGKIVAFKTSPIYADDSSTQNQNSYLTKETSSLNIQNQSSLTATKTRYMRIAFDFLVDNN